MCSPFPSQSWQRMLFTFWCFLADWSFSVACSNETFQNFDERQTQNQMVAHFSYPNQLFYQTERKMKWKRFIRHSLSIHVSCLLIEILYACQIIVRNTHRIYLLNTCYLVLKRILLLEGEGGSIVEGEELKAHVTNFYKMLFGFEE